MKIGLISRGRTQSTAIIQTLAKRHKLINNFETYFGAANAIKKELHPNNSLYDEFQLSIKNVTDTIFTSKNFICKIWPSMLIVPPDKFESHQTFDDIKSRIIFNISEYLRISEYDQLYYINKELQHSTLSWVYAKKTRRFHRFNKHIKYNSPVITIDDNDLDRLRFYILEYCLQEKIKDFLCKQKIPYTDISETYTQYIDDSMLNTSATNNDYPNLITNSDTISKFIDDWYNICCENTIDWKYY
jgi:hypothetical protein